MGLFGTTKKTDDKQGTDVAVGSETDSMSASTSRVRAPELPARASGRVGIDHAILLMRSLPTDKNVALVVTVLKTTLESLGIRVADIIDDAAQRQHELEARVAQFKTEIAVLEKEIDQRAQEIVRLESAHAETTKVRDYLQGGEIELVPDDSAHERPTTVGRPLVE